ncbi:recombinase family protein [Chloroflexota bacterium]
MRAVAYLRVSSISQVEGHSLNAQDRLFNELCKNRGWEVVRVYREEGRSAHVEAIARRPVFRQLLEDAAKGDFEVVVVHTLDRWARNQRVMLESFNILAKTNVSLVSITENIDYSTPQGKLFTQMLGSFAEYFSGALANHVSKGLDQRAHEGKHTGGIPFGYESCWTGEKGQRKPLCDPEHPGGIHIHAKEGPVVTELFWRYSSGTTTLSQLAAWLNEQNFRTRNTKRLPAPDGNLTSGPRLFTTASVRGILHNPFYTGKVTHRGKLLPGLHEALISPDVFQTVQTNLKKNSGRSETLQIRPERHYLLKGIIRCAYCGMPMWAQTYKSGKPFYREHKNSRSHGICPGGGSVTCPVVDEQISKLIEAIELGPQWLEEVLSIISLKDEIENVSKKRQAAQEKLRRMAKAYMDGLFPDEDYHRQKRLFEMELESLVVPQASATEEAGKLIMDLPKLWAGANIEERRKLLLTMLDTVYVDAKQTKSIVAIKPKPPFKPVFQVAASRDGSDIRILNEPLNGSSVFLVETGERQTLPETRILCFV